MTNDEIKKEVLSRAHRLKRKKAKQNRRFFVGGMGLLCLALSVLLLPAPTLPSVVPTPINDTQTTTPAETQTVTTHFATQTASTTVTSSQTVTTQTATKHSNKGPHYPHTTTVASTPLPDSTLVLEGRTVYRLATEEDRSRYDIPQIIQNKNIGEYLGTVETRSDALVYSADHALAGGKVYTYKPVADKMALVILCNEKKLVFIALSNTVSFSN